jgi:tight adherence protein B
MASASDLIIITSVGLLTALACWTLIYGVLVLVTGPEARVQSRVRQFVTNEARPVPEAAQARSRMRSALFSQIDTRWQGVSLFTKLKSDIQRANLHMAASEFLAVQVSLSLGLALVGWLLFPAFALITAPAGFILGLLVARSYLNYLGRRRVTRFEDQLPDTLGILASSVKGGFSLFQAMQLISREAAEPMKTEFIRVVQEMSLGAPMESSLEGLAARVPTEDVDILVAAIVMQHQSGGNLSHVLDVLAHTIRERHRVQQDIRALTAQQRFSATLLALLPFLLALVLFIISPTYISHMFAFGWVLCMPVGAAIMSILGYIVMRRLASIDV